MSDEQRTGNPLENALDHRYSTKALGINLIDGWMPATIRKDDIADHMISTIELPKSLYGWTDARFETMAFGPDHLNEQWGPLRFVSKDEALEFHQSIVDAIHEKIRSKKLKEIEP